jgi:hypothetical protein
MTLYVPESEPELQKLYQVYYKSNQFGLDMNIQKTKPLILGKILEKN